MACLCRPMDKYIIEIRLEVVIFAHKKNTIFCPFYVGWNREALVATPGIEKK